MARSEEVIKTLDGLVAHLELDDANQLMGWLEDRLWDPVAVFELRNDTESFCVDAISASLMNLDGYIIELGYPFDIEQFHDEIGVVVAHFYAHAGAAVLAGRPLGDLEDEDDATAEFADWAGVAVDDLLAVLGGRWDPCDGLPEVSVTSTIYCWWVRQAEPAVAMGVAGVEVYVESARRDDDQEFSVQVEYPNARIHLRSDTSDEAGAQEWLASLGAAFDQAGGSASARSR